MEEYDIVRKRTNSGRPCGSPEFIEELENSLQRTLRPKKAGRKAKSVEAASGNEIPKWKVAPYAVLGVFSCVAEDSTPTMGDIGHAWIEVTDLCSRERHSYGLFFALSGPNMWIDYDLNGRLKVASRYYFITEEEYNFLIDFVAIPRVYDFLW